MVEEEVKPLMHVRMQWLQQTAGMRNERELRGVVERIELELERRAAQAELERTDLEWKDWWRSRQEERAESLSARVHTPARIRQERVETKLQSLQAQASAAAAENQRLSEARGRAWAEEKAEEAARRLAESEAREAHAAAAIARARNQELQRIEEELWRQDCLAQRRAEVMASNAAERMRREEAQHARDEQAQARIQGLRERLDLERQERGDAWDASIARIGRMEERRNEIVQDMARLRRDTAYRAEVLREMADRAIVSKRAEPLRRLLEALTQVSAGPPGASGAPGRPRQPSTPRAGPRCPASRPSSAGSRRPASAGTTLRPAAPTALADALERADRPMPPPLMWLDCGKAPSETASTDLPTGCHASLGEVASFSPHRAGSDAGSTAEAASVYE